MQNIKIYADDSFFPSVYLTDGQIKLRPDWGGVYPLSYQLQDHPQAYELAYRYEKYAQRVKWLSLTSIVSFGAMVLGGSGASKTLFWGGAIGTAISTLYGLHFQAKALHYMHKSINIYNHQFDRRPTFSMNYSVEF